MGITFDVFSLQPHFYDGKHKFINTIKTELAIPVEHKNTGEDKSVRSITRIDSISL